MRIIALALALAAGPERHPFSIDDLLALDRAGPPAVSPDGALVAYAVSRPSADGARLAGELWLAPVRGGAPRALTAGAERISSVRFSPDGRRIAFVSDRTGDDQAWVIDLGGGEARRATALPGGVSGLLWTADGRALLVISDVDPACGADAACNERAARERRERPHLATRLLFRHWNAWREGVRSHVLRVPLDGGAPVDLTPGDRDVPPFERGGVDDLAVSPDGRTLYFTAITDPVEAISTNADLHAVPVAGGPERRLTSGPGWDGTPRPSPDGRRLAWRSQPRAGYESDRFHLLVTDAAGAAPRDLTADVDLSVDALWWARGGRTLRFLALSGARHAIYEVDAAGGPVRRVAEGPDLASPSASSDGEVVAALASTLDSPPEIAVAAGGAVRVLTRLGAAVMDRVAPVSSRPVEARGRDGTPIHGLVVLPPGHRAGERHPAVVLVHGGPQGAWTDGWSWRWNALLYASRGWTVVLPNPRGSTGHGQAYTDAVRDSWGGAPYEDVLAVADAAVASGEADGARMCAAGASYGGYLVDWMAGQTDRFRCLVSHAGFFDLETSYYETEELWFPEWELGRPWERPDAYARWSPSRFVARWKTPILVTHGERDYRVPYTQGIAAFTAAQRRGIPSKLLVFPDEGHWISKPKNARTFHDVVLAWIGEHLAAGGAQTASTN